jgi:hypothetical protein
MSDSGGIRYARALIGSSTLKASATSKGSPFSSLIAFKRNAGWATQMIDAPGPSPTLHALALLVDGLERDRNT